MSIVAIISVTGVCVAQESENIPPADGYEALAAQLSTLIQLEKDDKQLPAVSIALIDDQRVVWAHGFGNERLEPQRPATAKTLYRVGSVSKLFTDLSILQLVDQGQVDLDAPVVTYLPSFTPTNPHDKPITLRQLMSHRSGLVREPPVGHYFDPDEPSLEATVASLNQTTLVYEPETRTKYSNAGIAVVGRVLEKLAGRSFATEIRERVLNPLGMDESNFELSDTVRERLADAQMWTHDGRTFPAPVFELGTSPAGNLYANVLDIAKFASAVFNDGQGARGPILSAATLRSMLDPQFQEERKDAFGLGFHLADLDGHPMVGHGGAVYGFSTQFHLLPNEKLGVVIVASKDGSNGILLELAEYALRGMLAAKSGQALPPFRSNTQIPPERARQLDGFFAETDGDARLQLIERNGTLQMLRGSFRTVLMQNGEDLIVDDVHLQGKRIKVLGPDQLQIDEKTFQRIPDEKPAEMPEDFRGIVGEYGWDHNELFVYERHGQLHCLIEWFYHYPLTQVDANVFAFPDHGLYHGEQLVFHRGEDGVATNVVAAEVNFLRRETGTKDGETFKIVPIKSMDEVREIALGGTPPDEQREFRTPELVELTALEPTLLLDIRYATTNNFMGAVFYQQPRAFMQKPAAESLKQVQARLAEKGYGLLIHDAYRPWYVTKMFWEATPEDLKIFVANPQNGSRHNRGCAVDLTLVDAATQQPIDMGAGYDEFSSRSFPDYPVANDRQRWHRELLRDTMEDAGFTIYEFEWWHFDFGAWQEYPILNLKFEEIQ